MNPDVLDLGRLDFGGRPGRFTIPTYQTGNLVHMLISGETGSGKSAGLTRILCELAKDPEIALVGVDRKGGLELGPWQRRFTTVARTPDEANNLLETLKQLYVDRVDLVYELQSLGSAPVRSWQRWMGPRVVFVVDEMRELVFGDKETRDLLGSIAGTVRALDINLICSTQYGLKADVGATLLSNLAARICFRMSAGEEYATALKIDKSYGKELIAKFAPIGPDEKGVCFVNGIASMEPLDRCKIDFVDDETLMRVVDATEHLRWPHDAVFNVPSLDEVLARAGPAR